jgi:hypothetical protein
VQILKIPNSKLKSWGLEFFLFLLQPFLFFCSYHKKKYINQNFSIMKTTILTLVILIICSFFSCNSDTLTSNPIPSNATDVYVVGETTDYDASRALFWKNEKLTFLTPEGIVARAKEISVADNHVYICGEIINFESNTTTAVYWKDGIINTIEENAVTHDILKSGNDLYITGVDSNNAGVYWKNGVKNILTTEAGYSSLMKMKMVGNELYINGATTSANGTESDLVYWKNGVKNILYTGFGETTSIDVENNIVYVSGKKGITGDPSTVRCFYSKNNEITTIDDISSINQIEVENATIHLCGKNRDIGGTPFYWKNGLKTNYPTKYDINDISVLNSNLFACGSNKIDDKFTIWIGDLLNTGPLKTKANAICVVQK